MHAINIRLKLSALAHFFYNISNEKKLLGRTILISVRGTKLIIIHKNDIKSTYLVKKENTSKRIKSNVNIVNLFKLCVKITKLWEGIRL